MQFILTKKKENNTTVISVKGEIDSYQVQELKDELNNICNDDEKYAVVSLEEVNYIDSSGLGALISGLKKFREKNGDLFLVFSHPRLQRIFSITDLDKAFEIFPSLQQALEKVNKISRGE